MRAALMIVVERIVETREHPRAVLERGMRGDVLHALPVDPDLAAVVEALEELLARVRERCLLPCGSTSHVTSSWRSRVPCPPPTPSPCPLPPWERGKKEGFAASHTVMPAPPSKLMDAPVMYVARSETRNAKRSANSEACATRPSGTRSLASSA